MFEQYFSYNADELHRSWANDHLRNRKPGTACDIGAGSGRDANWLAKQGWEVVAVEPSRLREYAKEVSHSRVTWLDDSLPDLKQLRALGHRFDLILLNAVWQHVRQRQRERVFRILCELLNPCGILVISLRKGEDESENREREFHNASSEELIRLGNQHVVSHPKGYRDLPDLLNRPIKWDWQIFQMPDDGTGNLPLLRHIIINDHMSSSYKLGLLRTLIKLAESAPGVVIKRTDRYVELPFGAVGLYWIKLYDPLLLRRDLRQAPGKKGYKFAKNAFYELANFSPTDINLGSRFGKDQANVVREAIALACQNIQQNPANFTTYPDRSDEQVFECNFKSVRNNAGAIQLTKDYLRKFGEFRVPVQLWQTLGQYACWLDPLIIREWKQLILPWQLERNSSLDDLAFGWSESKRDTRIVLNRAREIRDSGFPLSCIWSARSLDKRSTLEIDHCFPWSRWPNNDLWNLLPTRKDTNQKKSDNLPTAEVLAQAHDRIVDWWSNAWIGSPYEEQFFVEAEYSLPNLSGERPTLEDVHQATRHQRMRLKQNQQIAEWSGLRGAVASL